MTSAPVLNVMVSCQISIHECKDLNTRVTYEYYLKKAGAEIVDHRINFKTNVVKYFLRLKVPDGHTLESFTANLMNTPIWHLTSWAPDR